MMQGRNRWYDRRALIRGIGASVVLGLAGCGSPGGDEDDGEDDGSDEGGGEGEGEDGGEEEGQMRKPT